MLCRIVSQGKQERRKREPRKALYIFVVIEETGTPKWKSEVVLEVKRNFVSKESVRGKAEAQVEMQGHCGIGEAE
jgi:hypothetical protein